MAFFSKLNPFKTAKSLERNAEKLLDAGIRGIDKVWYTDEEKVDDKRAFTELYLRHLEAAAKESTPTSEARREIAKLIIWPFNILMLSGAAVSIWQPVTGKFLLEQAASGYGWAVTAVVVFYMGNHIARSMGAAKSGH